MVQLENVNGYGPMNDKIVLKIEKLFLAVMGCFFILFGLFVLGLESNMEHEPLHPMNVFMTMALGVIVLTGLFFRWMVIAAHAVIIIVMMIFTYISWRWEPGFGFAFLFLSIAILLFGLAVRRAVKGSLL